MKEIECACGVIFEGEEGDIRCGWCVKRHMDALKKKDGYKEPIKPHSKDMECVEQ